MFGIMLGKYLYVSGLILSLMTMIKKQLESYRELILSDKWKTEAKESDRIQLEYLANEIFQFFF